MAGFDCFQGGVPVHSYLSDLGLLRDRRFALLLSARTLSVLGSAFAPVALAFGVLGLPGATAATLSVVLTAETVPMIVFILFGGVLADRLPRKWVMMAGESLMAVGFLALGAMLLIGWTPLPALSAAAGVTGVGIAVMFPALTGIIPEVVPPDRCRPATPCSAWARTPRGWRARCWAAARWCCGAGAGRWW